MTKKYFVGIDTSNYTTSFALVNEDGEVELNLKKLLPVKNGECGLRQSDAVFAHVKNIPALMEKAKVYLENAQILAIGVSSKPRNVEGSYMPCFLSGVSVARAMSAVSGAPIYEFSHQCGHMMSALYSAKKTDVIEEPFCAFHVSGGTTEILYARYCDGGFSVEHIGGTKDLNAGQLIDRTGVMMGLSFPCGASLEKRALENTVKIAKKSARLDGTFFNLSGAENLVQKMYEETKDASLVSAFTLSYVGNTLLGASKNLAKKYGDIPFIYAGGVMSNSIIKGMLSVLPNAYFSEPEFSSDNASGIALLARKSYLNERK